MVLIFSKKYFKVVTRIRGASLWKVFGLESEFCETK